MATSTDVPRDGRVQRSERSREAIVSALLDLIREGTPAPTAQQVAERADVGVRTVFRHFSDMDSLYVAMHERLIEEVEPLFVDQVQTGPLSNRLESLVERRFVLFEKMAPFLRSSIGMRARSAFLQAQHDRNIRSLRRDLHRWLPEVASAPSGLADAIEMILSFEAFNRLRSDQRLGTRRAQAAMRHAVLSLAEGLD